MDVYVIIQVVCLCVCLCVRACVCACVCPCVVIGCTQFVYIIIYTVVYYHVELESAFYHYVADLCCITSRLVPSSVRVITAV